MNIALIKDQSCQNVVVFDDLDSAIEMLGDQYDFVLECPDHRGISHRYINDIWYNPQPERDNLGVYPYSQDICVHVGDYVYGLDGKTYEAIVGIEFQQQSPEELPESYILKL